MVRHINGRMLKLTEYINLTIRRSSIKGNYSDTTGRWLPASKVNINIQANVQPVTKSKTVMLPEAERSKEYINVWSESEIRKINEGVDGWDADEFEYENENYKVISVHKYRMGVLDHYHALAVLHSPTPRGG